MKLTPKQVDLCKRIKAAGHIRSYYVDGVAEQVWSWYIVKPYSDEDARVVNGLLQKGGLIYDGDRDYKLSPEAIAALG